MDRRETQTGRDVRDAAAANPTLSGTPEFTAPTLISRSTSIADISRIIDLVAPSSASVLVTGESGTGKEIVARLIHLRSNRPQSPIVAINCAALPKDVIDNELFGHEREAFTGAASRRLGCFERAHQGTLFLDEIADMHVQVQTKLLRALESKNIRRLGGHEDIDVDVRVVAATNQNIHEALEAGSLRADLYYRLSVVEIHLPPLRERKEDIPLLADHFLEILCAKHQKGLKQFSAESMELLKAYDWPGNVRELRNITESFVLLCPGETIEPEYLPARISGAKKRTVSTIPEDVIVLPIGTSLEEAERQLILFSLLKTGNNKSRAARILGLSRKSMYEKLRRYKETKGRT
ncbi:MAG TPA: sigma-54 dependent transcriptional regulator [Bacteroidota bacterium]|nr:sigma-54 dependent transcriptional regulator [Bacteroidota bacterium]